MRLISKVILLLALGGLLDRAVINGPSTLPFTRQSVASASVYHGVGVLELVTPDQYVQQSIEYWKSEVQRRFQNPLLIVGHGNTINGVWSMRDERGGRWKIRPVAEVVKEAQRANPGRTIVLICCNPQGELLHMPGVYHALDSVWFTPDKEIVRPDADPRDQQAHNQERRLVGNIFEFVDD